MSYAFHVSEIHGNLCSDFPGLESHDGNRSGLWKVMENPLNSIISHGIIFQNCHSLSALEFAYI